MVGRRRGSKAHSPFPGGVAIVTDSTASLSPADADREGIVVVPLHVIVGAQSYVEGVDASPAMIAAALRDFLPVSTSRPNPEAFSEVYDNLADLGATSIVSVHLSSRMSGTVDSALVAAKTSPIPVHVVDSRQVGLATGFAAGQAARARSEGVSPEEIAEIARVAGAASTTLIYVDTLDYLRRGGRVGATAALIGSALAVKPLLAIEDGLVVPREKVRTTSRALARMEHLAIEAIDGEVDLGVQHLANESVARDLAGRLATALERDEVPVDEVGAAIGAHVGPGTIAVVVTPRPSPGEANESGIHSRT